MSIFLSLVCLFAVTGVTVQGSTLKLVPQPIRLTDGRAFTLNLPEGFEISVAAQGLRRVRFFARSPDGRIFVTDMHSLADNRLGAVYILDGFDPAAKSFQRVIPYLTGLRNPNSIAFYTDDPDGKNPSAFQPVAEGWIWADLCQF